MKQNPISKFLKSVFSIIDKLIVVPITKLIFGGALCMVKNLVGYRFILFLLFFW